MWLYKESLYCLLILKEGVRKSDDNKGSGSRNSKR